MDSAFPMTIVLGRNNEDLYQRAFRKLEPIPSEPSFDLCSNSVYGTELIKLGLLNTGMSIPAFLGLFNAMTA